MAKPSGLPEVTVDPGRVADFVDGIYGKSRASNAKAFRTGLTIGALVVGEAYLRSKKSKKRAR